MAQLELLKPEETKYQKAIREKFGDWWYENLGNYLNSDFKTKLLPKLKSLPPYFPEAKNLFKVYKHTPDPRVLILGQSPYHNSRTITATNQVEIQATGFAFECGISPSPSIKVLLNQQMDTNDLIGFEPVSLQSWVNQGVMLLNKSLTITKGNSKDFRTHDIYTPLIKRTIDVLVKKPNMCFIFYGTAARNMITKHMRELHEQSDIFIHESIHPAAVGYGTYSQEDFDNGFEKINSYLFENNLNKIDWSVVY